MKQALLIAGGYRIGDTFHLIPLLRAIAQEHEITWIAGQYSSEVVLWLSKIQSLNIKKVMVFPEYRQPGDITDRERFVSDVFKNDGRNNDKIDSSGFDYIVTDVRASFEVAFNYANYLGNYPDLTHLDLDKESNDYICVQPDSISKQKSIGWLVNLEYPLHPITLGRQNELLVKGSIDKRGVPLAESLKLLKDSKFNVCIHSSMACASFYLNKPTIVCHFFEGQFKFGKYHENCTDLITPTSQELQRVMQDYNSKY